MTFLRSDFLHDIFLSYAHADPDSSGKSDLNDWSLDFAEQLERTLKRNKRFSNLSIFFDRKWRDGQSLERTAHLGDELKRNARGSALLVALINDWYLCSSWCKEERDAWREGPSGQLDGILSRFQRAFVVRLSETNVELWPAEFKDSDNNPILGYFFYDREKIHAVTSPLGIIQDAQDTGNFRRQLARLAHDIAVKLDKINAEIIQKCEANKSKEMENVYVEGKSTVFVHARAEAKEEFDLVCQVLLQNSFLPVPTRPLELTENGYLCEHGLRLLRQSDCIVLIGVSEDDLMEDMVIATHAANLVRDTNQRKLPGAILNHLNNQEISSRFQPRAKVVGFNWLECEEGHWPSKLRSIIVDR